MKSPVASHTRGALQIAFAAQIECRLVCEARVWRRALARQTHQRHTYTWAYRLTYLRLGTDSKRRLRSLSNSKPPRPRDRVRSSFVFNPRLAQTANAHKVESHLNVLVLVPLLAALLLHPLPPSSSFSSFYFLCAPSPACMSLPLVIGSRSILILSSLQSR